MFKTTPKKFPVDIMTWVAVMENMPKHGKQVENPPFTSMWGSTYISQLEALAKLLNISLGTLQDYITKCNVPLDMLPKIRKYTQPHGKFLAQIDLALLRNQNHDTGRSVPD